MGNLVSNGGEVKGRSSVIGRVAAAGSVVLAVAIVAIVLLTGGAEPYVVKAQFQNASQVVKGNLVQVGGRGIGTVEEIELTRHGVAELTLELDDEVAPLRRGTTANLRIASLSGVANRYVDLQMPEGKPSAIPSGGTIGVEHTTSQVELDQLFNTFDKPTRKGLTKVIRGFGATYAGRGPQQNQGWHFLNPSLVGANRLFQELTRDRVYLQRFVVAQSRLVTDIADRRDDLSALVDRLAVTTGAIAREDESLAAAISELPPFMRRANSTFVNLRATLDDLDPLLRESRPAARRLRPFLAQLRPFTRDARPTIRDLSRVVRSPGRHNDLIELGESTLPLRDITIGPVQRNGKERPGSFETSTKSLGEQTGHFAFQRPYAVDLTGWFDDFSHSGIYDANGSISRNALSVNAFASLGGLLIPIAPQLRDTVFSAVVARGQNNRCPGSVERNAGDGGNPFKPSPDYNCNERQGPVGR